MDDNVVPSDYVIVACTIQGEVIRVCVRPGEHHKVIGFRD